MIFPVNQGIFSRTRRVYAAAALIFSAATLSAQVIQNGSFENEFTGWTASGHLAIVANDPNRPASEGANVVVFNPNDQSPNGVLAQSFATDPGQRYELAFDYGVVGPISDQRLQVTIEGDGVLYDQVIEAAATDSAPFYIPQHVFFTANSPNTKVTFADGSYTYVVIDSFLDNVRVNSVAAQAPSFASQPQRLAVVQGSDATFTVGASGSGTLSYQWQFNGADIAGANDSSYTVTGADVTQAGNYSVVVTNSFGSITSSAATLTILPPAILLNGSFEFGSAAWTFSGVATSTSTNPAYGMTDGDVLAHFNWGQQPPGGSISQTFLTTDGQTYLVNFDLGAFSLDNQNEQRARVTLTGSNNVILTSQDFSVFAPGNGGQYTPEAITFTANGPTTTLTFLDISSVTQDVDLLLDNVRVTTQTGPTPTATPTPAPTPTPLIVNGDFETGPFDATSVSGWTVTGHLTDASNEGATSGLHCAAFSVGGDSQGNILAQQFSTTANQVYTLDFDAGVFGQRTGSPLQFNVQVLGKSTLLNQTVSPPDALTFNPNAVSTQHYHLLFTADGSKTTLRFSDIGLGNANADVILDSVVVAAANATPTPTPTPTATATPTPTPTPKPTPTPTPKPSPTPTATPLPTPSSPSVVRVSASSSTVVEGGTATLIVTALPVRSQPLTVSYTLSGSAAYGTDYTMSGPLNHIEIPAGQSSASITIHALPDATRERTETIKVKLSPGVGYKFAHGGKAATIRIVNAP